MVGIWPITALPATVFSEQYFTLWVWVAILWGTLSSVIIIVLPVVEYWTQVCVILDGLVGNLQTSDNSREIALDMSLKLSALLAVIPEAERLYLQTKDKALTARIDAAFTFSQSGTPPQHTLRRDRTSGASSSENTNTPSDSHNNSGSISLPALANENGMNAPPASAAVNGSRLQALTTLIIGAQSFDQSYHDGDLVSTELLNPR
eukprot:TRINITY_DN4167_c0_g3_i2.p1 TRINITY_DN4167_c0_g3~~TRINITY_DN4167_c0_g3_i2.p1  ORF type:complete len:212 (-),score=30.72 TRINITY_DN4167_c0_g3_i2:236-850(-)